MCCLAELLRLINESLGLQLLSPGLIGGGYLYRSPFDVCGGLSVQTEETGRVWVVLESGVEIISPGMEICEVLVWK